MGEEKTLDELILTAQKTGQQEDVYNVHQAVLPFCYKVSKPFVSFGTLEKEEVEGIAYLSLVQALSVYDSKKGSFLTVLKWSLLRELASLSVSNHGLKLSYSMQTDLRKLRMAQSAYTEAHEGQMPEVYDLCESLSWDCQKLAKVQRVAERIFRPMMYLNQAIQNEDGTETELGELIADEKADFEEEILEKASKKQLSEEVQSTLDALPKEEGEILRLRYLDNLTLDEISKLIRQPRSTCYQTEMRAKSRFMKVIEERNLYKSTGNFQRNRISIQEAAVLRADRYGTISNYLKHGEERNGTIRKIRNS